MDLFLSFVYLAILACTCFYVLKSSSRRQLPPGPYPLPIIGNFLELGQNPHRSLTKLSEKYGPILYLKLGSVNTVVVSSPELARQVLQKHDQVFAGRTNTAAVEPYDHNKVSMAWMSANPRWRVLRKICKEHMFSMARLDSSQYLRQEKLRQLREYVHECCRTSRAVDISDAAFTTSLNLISASLFSIDFAHFNTDSSQELKELVHGMMELTGTPNLADYFPVMKPFDPQGIKRKSKVYAGKVLAIFHDIIEQRLRQGDDKSTPLETRNDLLESLLDLTRRNENDLSRKEVVHLLLDLFAAGTESTTTTAEWVMTELIRNPSKMSMTRQELQTVVGENKEIQESDISNLPYLRAVVKEVFRLHPPGPFLIPHKAETDTELEGYILPKDTQILVNLWKLGRDPSSWLNPDVFEPE
ncbi:cytochrome P450 76T24-like [Henckelia pumila]|uniref:cytochrome P450 76T24-like n=1 Tax=Henckelia pumila TaxID=405737 RepID=UPI003C6E982E